MWIHFDGDRGVADKLDDEGVSKLNTLTRLTQRMQLLLDSLLYYSRLGRAEFEMRETPLQRADDNDMAIR